MGWDPAVVPDPQDDGPSCGPSWTGPSPQNPSTQAVLDLYRRLIALRRERPELTDPRFARIRVRFDEDERWLVAHRGGIQVAVNIGAAEVGVPLRPAPGPILLATTDAARVDERTVAGDAGGTIAVLPPHSALVLAPPD